MRRSRPIGAGQGLYPREVASGTSSPRLGADVGEAAVRLVDALQALGYSEAQARAADVWALRDGVYRRARRAER